VFSGTGSQTVFTLASDPGALGNSAQVYIGGVYQQRSTYTIAGTTLTFSAAPVAGTDNIEFVNFLTSNIGATSADLVTYTPAGVGAVARSAASKFGEVVSVKDFGAVGDGVTDDYVAIQAAIDAIGTSGTLYFPKGIYKVSQTLVVQDTNPYPAAASTGNHGITLRGDGRFSTWIVHSGTQATGCLNLIGNANWFPSASQYLLTNNCATSVEDMALASNYGPAMLTKFAARQRHKNVFVYSAGTTSAGLDVQSCQLCYYDGFDFTGNLELPADQIAVVNAALPSGKTNPRNAIYVHAVSQDDGTHGSSYVAVAELYFDRCRTDGQNTQTTVLLEGHPSVTGQSEAFICKFSQCKFWGYKPRTVTPDPYSVVTVDGFGAVAFNQCDLEPNPTGGQGNAMIVQSVLGNSSVTLEECAGEAGPSGFIMLGALAGGDVGTIRVRLTNSAFWTITPSASVLSGSLVQLLHATNCIFGTDLAGALSGKLTSTIPNLFLCNNWVSSGATYRLSKWQAIKSLPADISFDSTDGPLGYMLLKGVDSGTGNAGMSNNLSWRSQPTQAVVDMWANRGLTAASDATFPSPRISVFTNSTTNGAINMYTAATGGATTLRTVVDANGALIPASDNTYDLGIAANRWREVFAVAPVINTSDVREKEDIRVVSTAERATALALKNKLMAFRFKHAIADKGDAARIHFGIAAQEVAECFLANGLNPENYAVFCHDSWPAVERITDEHGVVLVEGRQAGDRYGIRYDELFAFILSAI